MSDDSEEDMSLAAVLSRRAEDVAVNRLHASTMKQDDDELDESLDSDEDVPLAIRHSMKQSADRAPSRLEKGAKRMKVEDDVAPDAHYGHSRLNSKESGGSSSSDDDDIPLSARRIKHAAKREPLPAKPTKRKKIEDGPVEGKGGQRAKVKRERKSVASTKKKTPKKEKNAATKETKKVAKAKKESSKNVSAAKEEKDALSKKYEMPGQRKDAPPDNDPLRLFYQSMYKEKLSLGKESILAETWMLRHGLLEESDARKVLEKIGGK